MKRKEDYSFSLLSFLSFSLRPLSLSLSYPFLFFSLTFSPFFCMFYFVSSTPVSYSSNVSQARTVSEGGKDRHIDPRPCDHTTHVLANVHAMPPSLPSSLSSSFSLSHSHSLMNNKQLLITWNFGTALLEHHLQNEHGIPKLRETVKVDKI